MKELPTFFEEFLRGIRPTAAQRANYRDGHRRLRKRLLAYAPLADVVVTTFLQGSYRRATACRPTGDKRPDVDVIVVTDISSDVLPRDAMDQFIPFLDEYYAGKWSPNDRSFHITLDRVELDLVITSRVDQVARAMLLMDVLDSDDDVASDARWDSLFDAADQEWREHPLWIPDRELEEWQTTHPLAQIHWTWEMNRACDGHYVNVVKSLKWWRGRNPDPKYPRSYPFEHLVGQCCPRGITSVAVGVTETLEAIRDRYAAHARRKETPYLRDHGVDQDVLRRVTGEDFAAFHRLVSAAADVARAALDETSKRRATEKWRELLGDEFPLADDDEAAKAGFTERTAPTVLGGARYG